MQANHISDRCTRSDGESPNRIVSIPVEVHIGHDARAGDVIGPWIHYPLAWTCIRQGEKLKNMPDDRFSVKTRLYASVQLEAVRSHVYNGRTYQLYRHKATNVGVIAHVRQQIEGGAETITPLALPPGAWGHEWKDSAGPPRRHGDESKFHATLEMRLVKLDDAPIRSGRVRTAQIEFSSSKIHSDGNTRFEQHSQFFYYLDTTLFDVKATCTTPDQRVDLGTTYSASLTRAGDAGPATDFTLEFKNCPPNMATVQYTFQSVPRQTITDGILPLAVQPGSASGVGVQVLQPDGITPLAFDTPFPLSTYDPTAPAPRYDVPLRARIIRTPGPLSGGDVKALMEMEVTYK